MYEELVKRLRNCAVQAADAIEELSNPKWIPVTERLPEDVRNYSMKSVNQSRLYIKEVNSNDE